MLGKSGHNKIHHLAESTKQKNSRQFKEMVWTCWVPRGYSGYPSDMLHPTWPCGEELIGHTEYTINILGTLQMCWVPLGYTTDLLGTTVMCWVPHGHTGYTMEMLGTTWTCWVPHGHVGYPMDTLSTPSTF